MACSTAGCGGSGCYKEEEDSTKHDLLTTSTITTTPATRLCYKCKVSEAITTSEANLLLCPSCFRISLYGKFKQAITTQDLISPTDNVLVAFSGGPASRVALDFVHEMQSKAQRNSDASRDKSYPVFGVGVAFIDESAAYPSIIFNEFEKEVEDMQSILSTLAPPSKQLHVMPIENILSSSCPKDAKHRLKELLHTITDVTGKQDFLQHLRSLCLQKIALENKYTKLVLGTCSSTIACNVLSATVKGQGYSLSADIQYIDARGEIPVVLPLRDCVAQELSTLCHINSLKTLDMLGAPRSGINGLVSSFITLLQEENPARERTIVRTAEKLIPFHFNKLPETNGCDDVLPRWRRRRPNLKPDESIPSEFFCPICSSPYSKSELESLKNESESYETHSISFGASCCSSCQFQIVPKDNSSMEQFYELLPQQMSTRVKDCGGNQTWLRARIADCLLSDD